MHLQTLAPEIQRCLHIWQEPLVLTFATRTCTTGLDMLYTTEDCDGSDTIAVLSTCTRTHGMRPRAHLALPASHTQTRARLPQYPVPLENPVLCCFPWRAYACGVLSCWARVGTRVVLLQHCGSSADTTKMTSWALIVHSGTTCTCKARHVRVDVNARPPSFVRMRTHSKQPPLVHTQACPKIKRTCSECQCSERVCVHTNAERAIGSALCLHHVKPHFQARKSPAP